MSLRPGWMTLGLLGVLALGSFARGEDETPEEFLKSQGLRKVNQSFVLADEAALTKKFRELDGLRKKAADAQQKALAAESKVEEKKKLMLDYAEKRRALRMQIEAAKSVDAKNRLINMSNELVDRSMILEKSDKEEKEASSARAAAVGASEQYIELLLKLRKQYDKLDEQYDKLAEDEKVQQAIEAINQESEKTFKLGPTGSFATLDRSLKKLEGNVLSETISLRRGDGNLWHVTVVFNGKSSQDMAIDTGASIISLPSKTAEAAGLKPSSQDPTINISLADGRVVEAKQVFAPSVRIGKFTVEHVECAVMPADLPNAQPLLGLSFLRHFSFKIDSDKGKLNMCKIETPDKTAHRIAGKGGSREKAGGSRDKKTAKNKEEKEPESPETEREPAQKQDPAQKLVALLKTGDQPLPGGFSIQSPAGELKFIPSRQETGEDLTKQFGQPDEIVKLPLKRQEGNEQKDFPCKLWTWGKIRVVIGPDNKSLFYAVPKE